MNYPLTKMNKEGTLLHSNDSFYSDEYAQKMCSLYLSDELYKDKENHIKRYYRLHAREPHSIEDALVYDITCPKCGKHLKQVGKMLSYYDLGLYECPACNKH